MNIAILQHFAQEGPGSIADWAMTRGHTPVVHHLYRGDELPATDDFDMLVVLGGGMSVHDSADYPWLIYERGLVLAALEAGKPVLGICLGAQQIALALGAEVKQSPQREVGFWPVRKTGSILPLPDELSVLHWHGETFDLPDGATLFASSEACPNQMFLSADGLALGLQCHIETTPEMVEEFCREDADYLVPPPGQGRWMQSAEGMLAEQAAYAGMREALFILLDAFISQARRP
ncbi:MAG: type 1 glutamine amidotransferase [Pseudomonadota bacterium]